MPVSGGLYPVITADNPKRVVFVVCDRVDGGNALSAAEPMAAYSCDIRARNLFYRADF